MELVSIVTMTYKSFKGLRKTMDSVLSQDYPRVEYIIADDGSPDFDARKVQDYILKHKGENVENVIVFRNEENVGTVKNLNRAYQMASGSVVMPLSCGDFFLEKDVVSRIMRRFSGMEINALVTRRVAIDQSAGKTYYIPDTRSAEKLIRMESDHVKQYRSYITNRLYDAASGSVLSIRRSRLEEMGWFDESYRLLEDSPFFLKFLREEPVHCAMDITGIGYPLTGVSGKVKNPLLVEDDIRVILVEKQKGKELLDPLTGAWVQNEYERTAADTMKGKLAACVRHPAGFAMYAGGEVLRRIRDRIISG